VQYSIDTEIRAKCVQIARKNCLFNYIGRLITFEITAV